MVILTDNSIGKENVFHSLVILDTGWKDHQSVTARRVVLGQEFNLHVLVKYILALITV